MMPKHAAMGLAALLSCALLLGAGGCATVIQGTTQRILVVTDPPGAECMLANARTAAPVIVRATPGEVEVPRDNSRLTARCIKDGRVVAEARYPPLGRDRYVEAQRREILFAGALLREHDGLAAGEAVTDDLTQHRSLVASQAVAEAAHGLVEGVTGPMAASLVQASAVAAPLMLGAFLAGLVSPGVDYASGAAFSYPVVIALTLAPTTFSDEVAREAYFAEIDQRFALAERAIRQFTEAECSAGPYFGHCIGECSYGTCTLRRRDDDDFIAVIAERRVRFDAVRAQTRTAQ